ncbi:hypothetical protein QR77_03250, partial [Streptomyces sp. 150FB]
GCPPRNRAPSTDCVWCRPRRRWPRWAPARSGSPSTPPGSTSGTCSSPSATTRGSRTSATRAPG